MIPGVCSYPALDEVHWCCGDIPCSVQWTRAKNGDPVVVKFANVPCRPIFKSDPLFLDDEIPF